MTSVCHKAKHSILRSLTGKRSIHSYDITLKSNSHIFSDESDEENAEERKKKEKENRRKKKQEEAAALKQTKKPRRHRVKGRRYYDSDHDADESELASESEIIGMLSNEIIALMPSKELNDFFLSIISVPDQIMDAFTIPKEKTKTLPVRGKRMSRVLSESFDEEVPSPKKRKDDSSLLKTILSQGSGSGKGMNFFAHTSRAKCFHETIFK